MQGAEYATKRAGVSSTPECGDLEEWFRSVSTRHLSRGHRCILQQLTFVYGCTDESIVLLQNPEPEVTGEANNVEVVRTFYTHRPGPRSDVKIWYTDVEFGFYEGVPKRVADLHATHIHVEVSGSNISELVRRVSDSCFLLPAQFPRISGINPKVELYVHVRDRETGKRRPIYIHELIETVIHDDDEWKERLPKVLTEWQLIFPKGESWGIMRITGYPQSPGPSRGSPLVDSFARAR